jgi:hypothetical protein
MDEEIDTVGPWTIKTIGNRVRKRIIDAAHKDGLSVGQWLERRANEWLDDGSPERVSHGQPGVSARPRASVDDICRLTEAAARLAETSGPLPKNLRASLARGLREAARERLPMKALPAPKADGEAERA